MSNPMPNAGETPNAETDSNGAGKPEALPEQVPLWKAEIRDISDKMPQNGDDVADPAVLAIKIPDNAKQKGRIMRIRESSVELAKNLKVYRKMGFRKKEWTIAKLMAAEEFGSLMAEKLSARIMGVNTFDSMEQIQIAEEFCTKIIQDENVAAETRLQAVNMMSAITAARVKMQEHVLKLLEKARDGEAKQSGPRVMPALAPMQVLAQPGSQVFVGANSGREPAPSSSEGE